MIKRTEIWVFDGSYNVYKLKPSDFIGLFRDDIYGDTYKNCKDYWELVEVKE